MKYLIICFLKSITTIEFRRWVRNCLTHKRVVTLNKYSKEDLLKINMDWYEKKMGYRFDINHPVLFTEKIQWTRFNWIDKQIPKITNKVTFKEYVRDMLGDGYTIPLYWHGTSIYRFRKAWNKLSTPFVIKSNLQSDGRCIIVVKDKNDINIDDLTTQLRTWLKPENTLLNSLAWRFYNSKPEILIEEYKETITNQLYDYKVFCFGGEPYCIYVAQDHFRAENSIMTFYDLEWDKLEVQYGEHEVGNVPKPPHYAQMLDISKKLSKDFPFVRVDFFDTKDKLYVAEMTFDPGGGFVPYHPTSFNKLLGDKYHLPVANIY